MTEVMRPHCGYREMQSWRSCDKARAVVFPPTRDRPTPVTTCTPFRGNPIPIIHPRQMSEATMPSVKLRASTILGAFEEAQSELVGRAVVLTDGKAGTVENVWLDELHGLRISITGHDGKWPISTIKFAQAPAAPGERRDRD
jgi:hypothetical protein